MFFNQYLVRLDKKWRLRSCQSPRTPSTSTTNSRHVISKLEQALRLIARRILTALIEQVRDMRKLQIEVLGRKQPIVAGKNLHGPVATTGGVARPCAPERSLADLGEVLSFAVLCGSVICENMA